MPEIVNTHAKIELNCILDELSHIKNLLDFAILRCDEKENDIAAYLNMLYNLIDATSNKINNQKA